MNKKTLKEKVESSKIKINTRYSPTMIEILELCNAVKTPVEIADIAFRYGYIQGVKAAKAERS